MHNKTLLALSLAFMTLACEGGPVGSPFGPGDRPLFLLGPAAGASDTICASNVSYVFGPHFQTGASAAYQTSGGTPLSQCGGLTFDGSSTNDVVLTYTLLVRASENHFWLRRSRRTSDGGYDDATVLDAPLGGGPQNVQFAVGLGSAYDAIAFIFRHGNDSLLGTACEAEVQFWRMLSPPTSVGAKALNVNTVRLTWQSSLWGRSVDSTQIYRYDGATWQLVASRPASASPYDDTGLAPGTYRYYLRHATVSLEVSTGECTPLAQPNSPNTSEVTATVGVFPAAPSNLTASTVSSSRIDLAWTDNANNETGFYIERSQGGTYAQIDTVGANVTSYGNTGLPASTTFSYRVRAHNTAGFSAYSNTASATTSPPVSVSISGPSLVRPNATCTWNAMVSNGTPPYTYSWSGLGSGTGDAITLAVPSGGGTLTVDVWDAVSAHATSSLTVTTRTSAPICMI
jgi:hypothetical protein